MAEPTSPAYIAATLSRLREVSPTQPDALFAISDGLLQSFYAALQGSKESMLPSFTDTLPSGQEAGTVVALDLGGSTLRVAVIELQPYAGQTAKHNDNDDEQAHQANVMRVLARQSWLVDDSVKKFPAAAFFDWIAARIGAVITSAGLGNGRNCGFGVTWSFPVELLSRASGAVQQMGKGYEQWRTIAGTDLKGHFDAALGRAGLRLRMTSLMNDTEATLLSHAYANPATRLALIWGTGLNAAFYVPLATLGKAKVGARPADWMRTAQAVVVNTEVSMFGGGGIVPLTDADRQLDANSALPGFQPLEQLSSGFYLGEILRLILVAAIERRELFEGHMPEGMQKRFSLDTAICSAFEEADPSKGPEQLMKAFRFQKPPTRNDLHQVRLLCTAISDRAASLIATTLFTLYKVQRDGGVAAGLSASALPLDHGFTASAAAPVAIAYCGAVAEKHATALRKAQAALDLLIEREPGATPPKRRLVLEGAGDSGLLGAAVGAVMNSQHEPVPAKL